MGILTPSLQLATHIALKAIRYYIVERSCGATLLFYKRRKRCFKTSTTSDVNLFELNIKALRERRKRSAFKKEINSMYIKTYVCVRLYTYVNQSLVHMSLYELRFTNECCFNLMNSTLP